MVERILAELETSGLLLKTDAKLPNVCALAAGEPIKGSWWAHPRSHEIFGILSALAAHPDVLVIKLVSGKDTFVHRTLWPAVAAIGVAREKWQIERLDEKARALLARVDREDEIQTSGASALALERALLVHASQVHTAAGFHAKILQGWQRFLNNAGLEKPAITPAGARQSLETLIDYLNKRYSGRGRLPWPLRADTRAPAALPDTFGPHGH